MRTKKILYITPGLNVGGAEKFLVSLSAALKDETSGQSMVSLTGVNVLESELDKKVQFIALPRRHKTDIVPILKLRKLIKSEQPDMIFCLNFFSYFFYRCATFLLHTKANRIISYHSTIHVSRKEYWMHKFYKMLLTRKDLIITVSHNQAQYTAKELRIPEKKFKTIYNGIDTGYWKPATVTDGFRDIRSEYNIPAAAKVIIKAAAFRKEKNHMGAVRALHLLHTEHDCKAYLLLLGAGTMMPEVKNLVATLGMEPYVIFAGLQKDVRPFYAASNVFTLCSTNVETFSIAALEAMASGLPCVLTNIGGASEMIVDGKTGYLCEPEDRDITQTWKKTLSESFDKEWIHNHVKENFGLSKMIKEYEKIL